MTKLRPILAVAASAAAILFASSSANAGVTVTLTGPGDSTPPAGFTVATFDSIQPTTYGSTTPTGTFTDGGGVWSGTGVVMNNQGGGSLGLYAQPSNDSTNYMAVLGGGTETVTYGGLKSALGLYWGSIDSYNSLTLVNTINHTSMVVPVPPVASGDQFSWDSNAYFTITGFNFNEVQFGSGSNSFEFDNVATAGVPEPATWAMMILGVGMIGLAARRRNAGLALAA